MPRLNQNTFIKSQNQKEVKIKSNRTSTYEESFIIYLALMSEFKLRLRRKTKKDSENLEAENIIVDGIENDTMMKKVNSIYNEWLLNQRPELVQDKPHKIIQRDKDKTRLNIILNVLTEELTSIYGENNFITKIARKSEKTIARKRLLRFFDLMKNDMLNIGQRINQWFKEYLKIPLDMTKNQSIKVVSFDDIPIELQTLIPSTISSTSNEIVQSVEFHQCFMSDEKSNSFLSGWM